MTYTGGSSAVLWANATTWQNRANNAWGASRVWGSGASWEQNYNDEVTAYNTLQGQYNTLNSNYNTLQGQYNSLQSQYNQAVSDRDSYYSQWQAWQGYAHSDPNVWTNRYNAGYAQATTDKQPPSGTVHLQTQATPGGGSDGWSGNIVSLTADRAGQWLVVGTHMRGSYAAGVQLSTGSGFGSSGYFWNLDQTSSSGNAAAGDWWQGFLSAGQQVQAQAARGSQGGGQLTLHMWFLPTQAQPH